MMRQDSEWTPAQGSLAVSEAAILPLPAEQELVWSWVRWHKHTQPISWLKAAAMLREETWSKYLKAQE